MRLPQWSVIMANLTEADVIEKWVHVAQKVFPPQTHITSVTQAGGPLITVRWKDEQNPAVLGKHTRGVDLFFPAKVLESYQQGDIAFQLKWDAFLESLMTEKLHGFDPHAGDPAQPERWIISAEPLHSSEQ